MTPSGTLRLGVFGGTFDPIHIGHLAGAQDAAAQLELDRVLFVPNRVPPHKQDRRVSSVEDRVAMVGLSVADNPLFELSLVELARDGPSYTIDTMRVLAAGFGPDVGLVFLSGRDALASLHTWHKPEQLLAEFEVVFLERPDAEVLDWTRIDMHFAGLRNRIHLLSIPQLEVSARDIRRRVAAGLPIRYYVLPAVEHYIAEHRLYRDHR